MTLARDWLISGAPGAPTSPEVLAGACERLMAAGVPLARADAYVRTLHPQFAGRAFVWTPEGGCHAIEATYEYARAINPMGEVLVDGLVHRRRLEVAGNGDPLLDELATHGMTETLAVPMRFTGGEVHALGFSTRKVGGFTDAQFALIEGIAEPMSRMAEILALRRTATNVVNAYVGRDAGTRVLAGKIRRGDTELIEAAIWFSDMRGFSTISSQLEPNQVIELLNELFDCQVPVIQAHGGEVLKFIGDGLLAIFTPGADSIAACCERALRASHEAMAALDTRNARAGTSIGFGIALHVGQVAYGNIGSASRLDFTCIGRAVNLAARLESVTGSSGHPVLASEAFAKLCPGLTKVGEFTVKGFPEPVPGFAPAHRG